MTKYDGVALTYDDSGNPTSYYNGTQWDMSWINGRELRIVNGIVGGEEYEVHNTMFAYCNNNPVKFSDSTGEAALLSTLAVVGIGVSTIVGGLTAGLVLQHQVAQQERLS